VFESAQKPATNQEETMNVSEQNLAKRWFEEVWNKGRREAIAEMLAPDAVIHDGDFDTVGAEGFHSFFDRMRATFSGLHVTIEDAFGQGDQVCVRWSCTGKHTGMGLGVPPTDKALRVTGITIIRVAGGRLVEGWQNWDMLGMLEQIKGGGKSATYIAAP
jgi:steroid delta-isomerase-like uncharacterized protein